MTTTRIEQIGKPELDHIFVCLGELMGQNRDYLIELDAAIGDGDLGITMSKGFKVLGEACKSLEGDDLGRILMKLGMTMAETVPSTMGTLMATGLISGGKALKGIQSLKSEQLALLFESFASGIMERGKAKPGEKTVVDSLYPAAVAMKKAATDGRSLATTMRAGYEAAVAGLHETVQMKSTYGKAAIYQEKSIGKQDPGATVGKLFVEGFYNVIVGE